jgi:MFS family permease
MPTQASREAASAGLRIGPVDLVPGVRRSHFNALLGASFFTIGLMTLVGNLQPYLFNAVLGMRGAEQGRLAGNLATVNEIVFLLVASLVGAASDKVGRRPIYALGFVFMAGAFTLYPLATSTGHLFFYRAIFAIGAACVASMLAAVIADYAMERTRGRLVGLCFFLNGMGVALLIGGATALPRIVERLGADPAQAARCTYWTAAAMCLLPFLVVAFGLQPGAPARVEKKEPLLTTLRVGLGAARDPRVLLSYLSAMVSRGDLAVLSTFFLQWLTLVGTQRGMTPAAALAAGSKFFVLAQIVATFWALVVIVFIDRFDRVLAVGIGMLIAAASYLTVGLIHDPLGSGMYLAAAFMGIGEMSGVLASQSLVGQVASERGRGAIIGVFSMFGAAGILVTTFVGGQLFTAWRPSAPYILIGVADAVLAAVAFDIYVAMRGEASLLAGATGAARTPGAVQG